MSEDAPRMPASPGLGDMLGELADIAAGIAVVLLPLFVTALPGVLLMLVLPAVVLAAPLLIPVLLLLPPYLLVRWVRMARR